MVEILSGIDRSKVLLAHYKQQVAQMKAQFNIVPKLVVITVGEDPASRVYVGQKEKKAKSIGFDFEWLTLPETITQQELLNTINQLNADTGVNGMILQLPLPQHLNERLLLEAIAPHKDVDGFHPINMGKLMANQATLLPCTPKGILDLLKAHHIEMSGKHVVVVGRSLIVGLPLQQLLIHENATVTVCHSRTVDLKAMTKQADIIVSAVGQPALITKEMVKTGAVVIDVGINRQENGKLVGDVQYEEVSEVAAAITPVPGGVGPMTVAMLMQQTLQCACEQHQIDINSL
ncbi:MULTISPECIES: bifunctional methylenetetrahydrofolate dehydrogenase/methenyltetrahydrofolate cyclohydrolase FolD [unclassified Facklamia]|uniref:bifunctional methylenetetrahydrofolate dehydrogenase/methenyltetrahydrofolate cyclohydrolase FolD n=1 Tax=Aerococcaceae TaxID=186827 RepID=UPI0013B9C906|nr:MULTISPECIES: bifunctional methylenetetrahydrofolate dehydrogenase/methenyltetrahydrofolate cyclohydrolase FolD [unclassified Facklamia]NEW63800.1 bifunctional methylenetetrahydrofolate dehydrogenase/methenyltetrahydrofolate cyclohydrolase FolD [Facklamia sp. 252]NEW67271.1 bifunctional methylenetetrahydrofolate dehydrogenase/methenyltetrahydrofolate cyclohydrolase FolD [Facklamia sp. 253]QQD65153.1 bifunctional methylenetetrahydrofolate dehydrogenase/methenyltetrahydrofolate cyclohydrolase F